MKHKRAQSMKIRAFEFDTKAVDDKGAFSGYGSVFGNVDSYNEVVAPGAFEKSLSDLASKGRSLPVLWQHRTDEPIGSWTSLKEDDHGLFGDGELWLDDAPYARIAYRGMKAQAITGLSIGYYVLDDSYNEKTRIRTLNELELVEVSIVTVPANDEARVDLIKSKLSHGDMPSIKEFEQLLREAGFSKTQAAVIANRGLSHLLRSESEGGKADESAVIKSLSEKLSGFSLPKF